MKTKNELTVIISAFNEEKNIEGAVKDVIAALKKEKAGFEMIIMDDGSTDKTASVSAKLAKKHDNLCVIRNPKNLGLGRSFAKAIAYVKTPYLTVFPGDNDMAASSLLPLLKKRQEADLISAYMESSQDRSFGRRVVSRCYIFMMNRLFGLRLRYYNGSFVCRSNAVRAFTLRSVGLDVYAETKVRMIKKGFTYKEVPFEYTGRKHGKSKALTAKSILRTIRNTLILYHELNFK